MTEQREQGKGENERGDEHSTKNKVKKKLKYYTKQLVSIGALQQAIVKNIQKEIESV